VCVFVNMSVLFIGVSNDSLILVIIVTVAWLSGRSFGHVLKCMHFAVLSKLECVWRCRLVPARAARCATCLWTFGSINLPQAFYLRRATQTNKITWTCIIARIRFNHMYPVGQKYKANGFRRPWLYDRQWNALYFHVVSGRLWARVSRRWRNLFCMFGYWSNIGKKFGRSCKYSN